jgi:hypothetical protein
MTCTTSVALVNECAFKIGVGFVYVSLNFFAQITNYKYKLSDASIYQLIDDDPQNSFTSYGYEGFGLGISEWS